MYQWEMSKMGTWRKAEELWLEFDYIYLIPSYHKDIWDENCWYILWQIGEDIKILERQSSGIKFNTKNIKIDYKIENIIRVQKNNRKKFKYKYWELT